MADGQLSLHQRATWERLFALLPDIVAVVRGGRFVYVNPAFERALGHPASAMVGVEAISIVHPDARETTTERLKAAATDPASAPQVHAWLHRDGHTVAVEITAQRIELEGQPALLTVGRDVSDRVRAEQQLLVADRMVSMGALAAGVAHEINNPLAAVLANLEFLRQDLGLLAAKGGAGFETQLDGLNESLADAREAAERVRQIAKDLKVFSRGADEEHTGAVDVQAVLESTVRLAWNEIRHRARLVRDYGPTLPVQGNEARLGQVFLNLLVNAAQAITEGHFDANEIRLATRTLPDGRVEVLVKDSGCGIPVELQPRLFTPFVTTKPVGIGTGLGLSICQRIVTSMGGSIDFESRAGAGTTFFVRLPSAPGAVAVGPGPALVDLPVGRRGRVLVVDDEPLVGSSVRRALAGEHEVTVVTRGAHALALLRDGQAFDVVFCDLMMPEMTGLELFRALEALGPDYPRRVVFLTGGAFTPAARAFLDSVTNPRVEKPFDVATLRRVVAACLSAG